MKLTILGTGCAWTKRECASYLINDNIMIDPGYGSIKQVLKCNDQLFHHEKIEKIDLVLITHFHSDHYFDMPYILQKEATGKFPDQKLMIIAPEEGFEHLDGVCKLAISKHSYNKIDIKKYCRLETAEHLKTFKFKNYEITSVLLSHGDTTNYGYMIKLPNGKTLSFTGDTTMCDNLMYMLEKSDIILMNMASVKPEKNHYNIVDGIELMKKYKHKCIVPAHLTSQAYDYAKKIINIPTDLLILDLDKEKPYDFVLKQEIKKPKEKWFFKKKDFQVVEGKTLKLSYQNAYRLQREFLPRQTFKIIQKKSNKDIGLLQCIFGYDLDVETNGNIITFLEDEYAKAEIYEELYKLCKKMFLSHNVSIVHITNNPKDTEARTACENIGASLKEVKFLSETDKVLFKTSDDEKCIWEFKIK